MQITRYSRKKEIVQKYIDDRLEERGEKEHFYM